MGGHVEALSGLSWWPYWVSLGDSVLGPTKRQGCSRPGYAQDAPKSPSEAPKRAPPELSKRPPRRLQKVFYSPRRSSKKHKKTDDYLQIDYLSCFVFFFIECVYLVVFLIVTMT